MYVVSSLKSSISNIKLISRSQFPKLPGSVIKIATKKKKRKKKTLPPPKKKKERKSDNVFFQSCDTNVKISYTSIYGLQENFFCFIMVSYIFEDRGLRPHPALREL